MIVFNKPQICKLYFSLQITKYNYRKHFQLYIRYMWNNGIMKVELWSTGKGGYVQFQVLIRNSMCMKWVQYIYIVVIYANS